MWLRKTDLLGLAIGFVLGGISLVLFLPQIEALIQPSGHPPPETAAPVVETRVPSGSRPVIMASPVARRPAPAPRPDLMLPDDPPPGIETAPMPQVITPLNPDRNSGIGGTGFFIAEDGTVMTAAHVVSACKRREIVSPFVRLAAANLLAVDTRQDIALLRPARLHPPAILPLGRPAGASGQLFVLGYPASAIGLVPAEAWGTLENGRLPPGVGAVADPRELVWLAASAVRSGYSGGPILDPRNGNVVGIIKGTVTESYLRLVRGLPATGVAIGPGAGRLVKFLQLETPYLDTVPAVDTGETALEVARKATVHVLCWR